MADEPRPDRIKVFRRADKLWDWKAISPNGLELYGSLQGYENRLDCITAAQRPHPGIVVEIEEVTAP